MPRDDLSIDFAPRMAQSEKWDASMVLDEWALRVENLPHEIAFMQEEIAEKDRRMQECLAIITKCDFQIQKWIRQHGSHVPNPKQDALDRQVTQNFDKAQIIQAEKVALAEKTKIIMDKHTRWLDTHIKYLVDKGELQVEANFPSTLNANNNDIAVVSSVLAPINNVAPVANARHPNQYPQRQNLHAQVLQTSAALSASTSAATPNALQPGRNAREMSSGAGNANKRQKMLGGIPLQTSGLSRQTSNTPGTPRGATPVSGVRAGSTGPRSSQTATKKVISHGNKPTGPPRKHKKSTLNRVKGVRNKNSPSSTNDSELSDAESGSVDDDDAHTPAGNRDGDEDMGDPDEENGEGDDKVYCICQKVSFGDMVACDNENCEYEWFHWNCVGVKAEPPGSWICPPCTRSGFRK